MSATESSVTITLDLIGQRGAVVGLGQVTDALAALSAAVKDADAAVATSTVAMAAATTGAYQAQATEAESAALRIGDSDATVVKSNADLVASAGATADAVSASYAKMGTAATAAAAKTTAAHTSIVSQLTSMKTLVTGGVVYEAIKSFDNYQSALTTLGTQAGLTSQQIAKVSAEITKQAVTLRTTPTALAGAYYNPISEGFSVAQSANVVARAAQLANMSHAQLTGQGGTSYTLSTFIQSLGMKPTAANVAKAAAMLRGGTSAGDMKLSGINAANAAGYFDIAKSYGISEQSAMGNLAFFSSQGVSPETAAHRFTQTMAMMAAPTQTSAGYLTQLGLTKTDISGVSGQLAALGLTTTKMATALRGPNGINTAIGDVVSATKSLTPDMREALFAKLFGGGRSEAAALSLAEHPALANQMYQRVGAQSTTAKYDASWAKYSKTLAASLKGVVAAVELLANAVGKDLSPILSGFLRVGTPVLGFFAKNKWAVEGLALVLGGVLVKSLVSVTASLVKFAYTSATSLVRATAGMAGVAAGSAVWAVNMVESAATATAAFVLSSARIVAGFVAQTAAATTAFVAENAATLGIVAGVAALVAGIVWMAEHWKATWRTVTTAARDFARFFERTGEDIWHPIDSGLHALETAWRDVWTGIKDFTRDAVKELLVIFWPLTDTVHGLIDALHFFGVAKGVNVPLVNPASKLAGGGMTAGRTGGFATRGPVAIVGEGNQRYPEYVIPTDPTYRSRALGLVGQLAPRLMADGGEVGGFGLSAVGSGLGLLQTLRQLVTGDPTGALRSMLKSMSGAGARALPDATRSVEEAIATSVPGSLFRSLMLGVVSTMFGAASRAMGALPASGQVMGVGITIRPGAGASVSGNQALGQQLAAGMGWSGQEWTALQALWQRESGWSNYATNPRSGAYGIAQALPPSKYPAAAQAAGGSSARAQIDWGLSYIKQRYGDPAAAWAHEMAVNWYAAGGTLPVARYDTGGFLPEGPSITLNGTGAPELVSGPGAPVSGDLNVNLVLDGAVVAQTTVSDFRRRVARR